MSNGIPRIIHVVWVGDESKRPDNYIQSWIDKNPSWTIKIWGNQDYSDNYWINKKHMEAMWKAGSFHGVADLMRYEILYNEGGFTIDADSLCLRSLDDSLFDEWTVVSYENEVVRKGLISNGFMASVPKRQMFADIISEIEAEETLDPEHAWHSVGPKRLTDYINQNNVYSLKILPFYTFLPDHFDGYKYGGDGIVYAKQLWGTTKGLYDNLYKMNVKPKICVYAISKNEAQFVQRYCESAIDADLILIADTGSTDGTDIKARIHGATVHTICISPWRFDHARNAALALVPRDIDICVSLDLDEVLEPGWREEIERVWEPNTTRLRYMFDWGAGIKFQYEKIHARHGYHWHHPCHEYPRPDGRIKEVYAYTNMLLVSHYPDPNKSRGQYLDLLKLSIEEDPFCPRNAFYYARELSFYCLWDDAIRECERYLALPNANWANERCYAYRVMAKCYAEKGDLQAAETAFHKAASEAPNTREPWAELAMLMYRQSRWEECFAYSIRTLRIKDRDLVYTCDPSVWGYWAHDLASISAWNLGLKEIALEQAKLALEHSPNDPRLKGNLDVIQGLATG